MTQRLLVECVELELSDPKPVSINKLYSSNGDQRFLTTAGKRFKDALRSAFAQQLLTRPTPWKWVIDYVYEQGAWVSLDIELHLESMYNKSWKVGGCLTKPRKREDGTRPKAQPRSPYKKIDATNYVKLIEDAVVAGTGIDDSCHLETHVRKYEDLEHPRIVIRYCVYE